MGDHRGSALTALLGFIPQENVMGVLCSSTGRLRLRAISTAKPISEDRIGFLAHVVLHFSMRRVGRTLKVCGESFFVQAAGCDRGSIDSAGSVPGRPGSRG